MPLSAALISPCRRVASDSSSAWSSATSSGVHGSSFGRIGGRPPRSAAFVAVTAAAATAASGAVTLEAAGPFADRLASVALVRRVGGDAVAPVAARVGLGTAFTGALDFLAVVFVARLAPAAGSALVLLLVVTALFLALLKWTASPPPTAHATSSVPGNRPR